MSAVSGPSRHLLSTAEKSAAIREGMRRAAEERRSRERDLKYPEFSKPDADPGPRPDDSASISTVWSAKHHPAIHFHHDRGMSRAALSRIYGPDTVNAVLGTVLS